MHAHGAPASFLPPQRPTGTGRLPPLRHGHRGAGTAGGKQEATAARGKNASAATSGGGRNERGDTEGGTGAA